LIAAYRIEAFISYKRIESSEFQDFSEMIGRSAKVSSYRELANLRGSKSMVSIADWI
jgi:hypothetical protein